MGCIAIIGTGTMAAGIAAGFITADDQVVVLGRGTDKASACLSQAALLAQRLRSDPEDLAKGPAPLGGQHQAADFTTWDDWSGFDWVIETVTENLPLKQAIFTELDRRVPPHIPIGSNSSGYPISKIALGLPTAHRMMGAHYFMPAEIVPLVEIVLGAKTAPELAQQVCQMYRRAGKKPVLVKQDIPGFLANRIQHALMREALALVDAGIATPEDVDDAVRYSFGFRYAAVGPMTQKEISGWDGMANAAKEIYPSLSNISVIPERLAMLMAEGKTGMKAGEGFRQWTAEEIEETRARYNERLKAAFDVLNMP